MRALFLLAGLLAAAPAVLAAEPRPIVAIIDSGIADTPELKPLLIAEYDLAAATPRANFKPHFDHGTMVATILARESHRQVDIISLRIDDPAGCPQGSAPPCQPDSAPIVKAIDKARELGAKAINISLSLPDDPEIAAAVRAAAHSGILVVLAAGNNGFDHPGNLTIARAGYPLAVLVGALDARGIPWAGTNRPDSATPVGYLYAWQRGVAVPTAIADGAVVVGTGTSFAAPVETARRLIHEPGTSVPSMLSPG